MGPVFLGKFYKLPPLDLTCCHERAHIPPQSTVICEQLYIDIICINLDEYFIENLSRPNNPKLKEFDLCIFLWYQILQLQYIYGKFLLESIENIETLKFKFWEFKTYILATEQS